MIYAFDINLLWPQLNWMMTVKSFRKKRQSNLKWNKAKAAEQIASLKCRTRMKSILPKQLFQNRRELKLKL